MPQKGKWFAKKEKITADVKLHRKPAGTVVLRQAQDDNTRRLYRILLLLSFINAKQIGKLRIIKQARIPG